MSSKIKITPKLVLTVEIDGKKSTGSFFIESEWNGLIKLKCDSPIGNVIIRPLGPMKRSEQYVPRLFGGNLNTPSPPSIEAELISHDLHS